MVPVVGEIHACLAMVRNASAPTNTKQISARWVNCLAEPPPSASESSTAAAAAASSAVAAAPARSPSSRGALWSCSR